jgi:ribosomal-protein-alanine N-acetyltransferase
VPRVHVRPFVASDLEALHRIYGDPEVMRWVDGSFPTLDATRAALETHIRMYALDGFAFMAVCLGEDLIGEVGFGRLGDEIEMGWTFRRDAWGHGYATEAGRLALRSAPSSSVIAVIRRENAASQNVAHKLGFELKELRQIRGHEQQVWGANVARGPL